MGRPVPYLGYNLQEMHDTARRFEASETQIGCRSEAVQSMLLPVAQCLGGIFRWCA